MENGSSDAELEQDVTPFVFHPPESGGFKKAVRHTEPKRETTEIP